MSATGGVVRRSLLDDLATSMLALIAERKLAPGDQFEAVRCGHFRFFPTGEISCGPMRELPGTQCVKAFGVSNSSLFEFFFARSNERFENPIATFTTANRAKPVVHKCEIVQLPEVTPNRTQLLT